MLPANVTTGHVRHTFVEADGAASRGVVLFRPSVTHLLDVAAEATVLPRTISAPLDVAGKIAVDLIATDDTDLNPVDWTWRVFVRLEGHAERAFHIQVPGDSDRDLADITPVAGTTAPTVIQQGPQGEAGPEGPEGPAGPATPLPARLDEAALSATIAAEVEPVSAVAAGAENTAGSALVLAKRGTPPSTVTPSKMVAFFGATGHGYTATADVGGSVNLNDTTVPMLGTQSVRLNCGTATYARIDKTGMTPFSIVGMNARVWLRRYDANMSGVSVRFASDSGFANQVSTLFYSVSDADVGEDYYIDVPLGEGSVTGAPNLAAITAVRVFATSRAGLTSSISVGGIALVPAQTKYPNGVATFTFDDTHLTQYTVARPALAKYGWSGTLYPTTDAFGTTDFMTLAQAKYLQDVHGWDVGAHATTGAQHARGMNGQTEATLRAEFEAMVTYMANNDLRGDSYAWPNAISDALSRKVARDYFRSARGGSSAGQSQPLPAPAPFNFIAVNAAAQNLAANKAKLDQAKASKSWVSFYFHRLPAVVSAGTDVTAADFVALVDYAAAQGIGCATVREVIAAV